eukprot:9359642-Prorocentrum_lima.AAC.1
MNHEDTEAERRQWHRERATSRAKGIWRRRATLLASKMPAPVELPSRERHPLKLRPRLDSLRRA